MSTVSDDAGDSGGSDDSAGSGTASDSNEWSGDFSYGYFSRLLRSLDARFEIRTLSELARVDDETSGVATVRHDVDVCLERALELARIEHDVGVRSTYMVIPDSPLYDVEENVELVGAIEDLGHEIGLHYVRESERVSRNEIAARSDETRRVVSDQERREIRRGRRRLESLGVGPVTTISFHRPAERVIEGPPRIAGMVNAYSEELMSTYISDSRGRWREGPPTDSIEALAEPAIVQVLTHPVWWDSVHEPPIVRYVEFVEEFVESMGDVNDTIYEELAAIYPPVRPFITPPRANPTVETTGTHPRQ